MSALLEEYIDREYSGENSKKGNLLTKEDWNFIKSVSSRFTERTPSILERFVRFSWMDRDVRPMMALEFSKQEPRQGLIQRGYKEADVESIYEHTRNMSRILGRIFRERADLKEKYPGNRARRILVHDLGEALTTDFTPEDMKRISPKEKVVLEDLAMRLIFENDPKRYAAYVSYKNKETIDDALTKVADTLELLEDIARMKVTRSVRDEIENSSRVILGKYKTICCDLGVNFLKL